MKESTLEHTPGFWPLHCGIAPNISFDINLLIKPFLVEWGVCRRTIIIRMNPWVPQKVGNFLTWQVPSSFSSTTLLHEGIQFAGREVKK
jgi:hypothetical protein